MPYTLREGRSKHDVYIDKILLADDAEAKKMLLQQAFFEDSVLKSLARTICTTGDLNYTVSRILWSLFFRTRRYANAEDLIGVIEDVKHRLRKEPYNKSTLCSILFSVITNCNEDIIKRAEQTLECVKLEMYTRHIREYEDEKIRTPQNGDVNYEWPKKS